MSLEGLSSLIQLESTRLEGARQTSQNFQQANSAVQQVGSQTAQAKTSIWKDKIEATYSKEVQEATVRKLESKLARERKAEAMAKNIAMTVTTISALSNAWDSVSDLLGKQKLGDIPEYLKTPKIDPTGKDTTVLTTPNSGDKGSTVYAIGKNADGTESVQSMNKGSDNSMTGERSATVSFYDIRSILAGNPDYDKLVAAKGKNISFSMLVKENPALAEKVMKDKSHSMGRSESEDFVNVLKEKCPDGSGMLTPKATEKTTPPTKDPNLTSAEKLGEVKDLTDLKLAALRSDDPKAELAKIKDVMVTPPGSKTPKPPADLTSDEVDAMKEAAKGKNNAALLAMLSQTTTAPAPVNTSQSSSSSEFKAGEFKAPKSYAFVAIPQKNGKTEVTMYDKDNDRTLSINIDDNDPALRGKSFKNLFNEKNEEALGVFVDKVKKSPESGAKVEVKNGTAKASVDFDSKVNSSLAFKAAVDSLKGTNKLDSNYDSPLGKVGSVIGDVGKAGMNFVVNTAKDAAPYFQAYLAQKSRADSVEEELIEARQKLAAENKKLKNIQMQIDLFNGRGS